MNEQQLAAVKQALEALEDAASLIEYECYGNTLQEKAITALQSIIAQHALDKKADNARELGLNYDTPLSSFVRSSDEAKAEVMERVIDKATEEQKAVIGCVNHDCDQCKAVQEPVAQDVQEKCRIETVPAKGGLLPTPPAAQPVPVKTYHDGKPWPVAPKPWVGLTDEQIETIRQQPQHHKGEFDYKFDERSFARAIEAKLKEKNT
jgi:hypothetical protein